MKTEKMDYFSSLIFLTGVFLGFASCKQRAESPPNSLQSATSAALKIGIPHIYFGVMDLNTNVVKFDNGHTSSSYQITRRMTGIRGTGGQAVPSPFSCSIAEAWAGENSGFGSSDLCRVEFVGTGYISSDLNGVSLHIIPLARDGSGFDESTYSPRVSPLTPGPLALISSGINTKPNSGLDINRVVTSMNDVKTKFQAMESGSLNSNGQDCLKNAKASAWTDLQAHYYCLMPYTIRYCYSTILSETKNPAKAFGYCSTKSNESDWNSTRDAMFKPFAPGHDDWDWLIKNQGETFKYIMFGQLGKADFNIEQQNDAITKMYDTVPRPRRAGDPYPAWVKSQPRYDDIRSLQSGQTTGVVATPPVSPSPAPRPATDKALAVGLYAERRSLESVGCTARIDAINQNTGGNVLEILATGGSGCSWDSNIFAGGISAKIICKKSVSDCLYLTILSNGTTFSLPAQVNVSSAEISVLTTLGMRLVWSRVGP